MPAQTASLTSRPSHQTPEGHRAMRLYKVEITALPADALRPDESDPTGDTLVIDESWAPHDWLAADDERSAWMERHGDARFFWPATGRLYQSRSGAQARARLIESYGATVVVVESEPIVWLTPEVRRARRIDALESELCDLYADQITAAADAVVARYV